jgi:hypothetical protein
MAFAAALGGLGAVALAGCETGEELDDIEPKPTAEGVETQTRALASADSLVQWCDTYAELRTLVGGTTTSATNVAVVRGATGAIPEEGGGGTFVWSTDTSEADDGGTLIAASSGRTGCWKRLDAGPLNILWFGARRARMVSGVWTLFECGPAIRAAFDAAVRWTRGAVYVPAGTFGVGSTLQLRPAVSLVGESMESAHLQLLGTNSGIAFLEGGSDTAGWGSFGYLRIENLHLRGNWDGKTSSVSTGVGLLLQHAAKVRLNRVRIDWFTSVGLHLKAIGYSSIEECEITAAGHDCIWFESYNISDACTSTHVRRSQISTGLRSSVHITNGLNLTVDACQLEDSGTALFVDGNDNRCLAFTSNYVEALRGVNVIEMGTAWGLQFVCHSNYLGVNLPMQLPGIGNFAPLYIWGNGPWVPTPCRSDVRGPDCA